MHNTYTYNLRCIVGNVFVRIRLYMFVRIRLYMYI